MNTRKYMSEFGLVMCTDGIAVLQQDQLDQVPPDMNTHIYLVCRQPRVSIDVESLSFSSTHVSGAFLQQRKGNYERFDFNVPNRLGTENLVAVSNYPFTEIAIRDVTGRIVSGGKCALLASAWGIIPMDLEVLYVGQAFGSDGERRAPERLKAHSTLQGIYAQALKNAPDQEVWLVLASFSENQVITLDGRLPFLVTSDEDDAHTLAALSTPISEQQKINFTEAAIIRYFQPPYNKDYKDSFPNPAHSTYRACYELDLNLLCAEIQTFECRVQLWSQEVAPNGIHFCQFELHSREERRSMFDFSEP